MLGLHIKDSYLPRLRQLEEKIHIESPRQMYIYLVDVENVGKHWRECISKEEQSYGKIILFVTENAHDVIRSDELADYTKREFTISSIVCTTGKNALDFQLSSELGYLAAKYPEANYVIISKDKGYTPLIAYWSVRRISVTRLFTNEDERIMDEELWKYAHPKNRSDLIFSIFSCVDIEDDQKIMHAVRRTCKNSECAKISEFVLHSKLLRNYFSQNRFDDESSRRMIYLTLMLKKVGVNINCVQAGKTLELLEKKNKLSKNEIKKLYGSLNQQMLSTVQKLLNGEREFLLKI